MTKITSNIVKVGVHCYLPNAKINLRSNFNYEKLVKSETLLYGFAEVGIKGGEIFRNVSKFRLLAFLLRGVKYFGTSQISCARLSIRWASKYMIKFQF